MRCNNCQKEFPDDSMFCPYCGSGIANSNQSGQFNENYQNNQRLSEPTFNNGYNVEQMPTEYTAAPVTNMPETNFETPYAAPSFNPYENVPDYGSPVTRKKKKSVGKVIAIVILVLILIVAGVFAFLYFGTNVFGDGKCDSCDGKISKFDDYCSECVEKLTCKVCGKFDVSTVSGCCDACRKCKSCDANIKTGFYCAECIDNLDGGFLTSCVGCTIKYYLQNGSKDIYSYIQTSSLTPDKIYLIDKEGNFYCKDCETKKNCEICGGFISEDDDDSICLICAGLDNSNSHKLCDFCAMEVVDRENDYCPACEKLRTCSKCDEKLKNDDDDKICSYCAEYYCSKCDEVLKENEAAYEYEFDGYVSRYCKECDTGKYCEDCKEPLNEDDDDDKCSYCADYYCYSCDEVLKKDEIAHEFSEEYEDNTEYYYFCKSCDTGKYCEHCDYVLNIFDMDKACYTCAELTCWSCNEVLEKGEDSYKFYDYEEVRYLCERCDAGKYCTKCEKPLHYTDDDEVCYDCAQYICYYCAEVIGLKEIEYEHYDDDIEENHYYCKYCASGNYCEECGDMLYDDDDDTICYDCAERTCYWCGEVLTSSGEISYEYEDEYGDTQYYCDDCDSGKYCDECECVIVSEDDDAICSNCADYSCYECGEVLEEDEISYSVNLEDYYYESEAYYCSDCDSGEYCEYCNRVIPKYSEGSCFYCD